MTLAGLDHAVARAVGEQEPELGKIDFDAGDLIVPAHADLPEPELMQVGFEAPDLRETFASDAGAVGDAAGEAGGGRLVPNVHPDELRGCSHVGLREARLDEG